MYRSCCANGDVSLIGPIIAYGICGYLFSLVIWIIVFNTEKISSPDNRTSKTTAANAFLVSFGPLLHFPIYFLAITAAFSESLDEWIASLKSVELSFQVFTQNIFYAAGLALLMLGLNHSLSTSSTSRVFDGQNLLNVLLAYSLFTMLSFIGMLGAASDPQSLPQVTASIILPYGTAYLMIFALGHLTNRAISRRHLRAKDIALVGACIVIGYLSFMGLAPTDALFFAGIAGVLLAGLLAYLSNLEAKINDRTIELETEKKVRRPTTQHLA